MSAISDRQGAAAQAANADADIQNAQRGVFTGKYAEFAAQLPAAWSAATRNMVVAQQIARDKGIDTSALDASGGQFSAEDQHWYSDPRIIGPLVVGGVTAGLGAYGAAGAAAANQGITTGPTLAQAGAGTIGTAGTTAGAASAAVPSVIAPAATTDGGMSLGTASWLSPVIGSATSLAGAAIQAHAAGSAADKQAASAQAALDFLKAQKAKQEAAWAPYGAMGAQAASTLPGMIRQSPTGPAPSPYAVAPGQIPHGQQTGSPLSAIGQSQPMAPQAPMAQTGQMVMLQAPDGSKKSVPQAQAQFYVSRGAKVVA